MCTILSQRAMRIPLIIFDVDDESWQAADLNALGGANATLAFTIDCAR
jgi:hypothetical protein